MSRILKRPMFRKGGSTSKGIMTGLVDRKKYQFGSIDKEEVAKNIVSQWSQFWKKEFSDLKNNKKEVKSNDTN